MPELAKGRRQLALHLHVSKEFQEYMATEQGLRIGFRHESCKCKPARANMKSALTNPVVIDQYTWQWKSSWKEMSAPWML